MSIVVHYALLTCDAYIDTRLKAVTETWGKELGDRLTVMGSSYIENDGYTMVQEKWKRYFKTRELTADWYVLIDDDSYMMTNKFERVLEARCDTTPVCIGHYVVDGVHPGFRTGPGCALNNAAMKILKNSDLSALQHPGDAQLGDLCKATGIGVVDVHDTLLNRSTLEDNLRGSHVSMHAVSCDKMYELFNQFGMG